MARRIYRLRCAAADGSDSSESGRRRAGTHASRARRVPFSSMDPGAASHPPITARVTPEPLVDGAESSRTPQPLERPSRPLPDLDTGSMDDAVIVERVVRGDRDAFRILVDRHRDFVFRVALRVAGGDRDRADDFAQ